MAKLNEIATENAKVTGAIFNKFGRHAYKCCTFIGCIIDDTDVDGGESSIVNCTFIGCLFKSSGKHSPSALRTVVFYMGCTFLIDTDDLGCNVRPEMNPDESGKINTGSVKR